MGFPQEGMVMRGTSSRWLVIALAAFGCEKRAQQDPIAAAVPPVKLSEPSDPTAAVMRLRHAFHSSAGQWAVNLWDRNVLVGSGGAFVYEPSHTTLARPSFANPAPKRDRRVGA